MDAKERKIDELLGALTLEEKVGQMFVFGFNSPFADPVVEDLVDRYNVAGLRTSPYLRRFKRYLPEGSPGIDNVKRPPQLGEKLWDEDTPTYHVRASEYARTLAGLRARSRSRKHGIPIHFVVDYEAGSGSNYEPAGMLELPCQMGFGWLGDTELLQRATEAVGRQLRAIGFDQSNCPVLGVNQNPMNTGISIRSYSPDPQVVTDCARAALAGYDRAGFIAAAKHFPGGGVSEVDAHYGVSTVPLSREELDDVLLHPYRTLIKEGRIRAIMLAHKVYPALDPSEEISTVSRPIVTGVLREELGYQGVITTDSMTMGGLMARHSVQEACVLAIQAGVDVLLLKDDNVLRFEALDALTSAVRDGRIPEARLDESLRRVWSLKWDYGLFEGDGAVDPDEVEAFLGRDEFRAVNTECAQRILHVVRRAEGVVPLDPEQQVLVLDQRTPQQLRVNDARNHPGMFWQEMLRHSRNVTYVDYSSKDPHAVDDLVEALAPQVDAVVVTANFDRAGSEDTLSWLAGLKRFGKPVIEITNNPYPLLVPEEMETVLCTYALMRANLAAAADWLYGQAG